MSEQTLSPPVQNRHRASSTTLRPPLTIRSLGRRRSNPALALTPPPATPLSSEPDVADSDAAPSMLAIIASRILHILHAPHSIPWSAPSTPHDEDELILPLSASAHKTSFGNVVNEKTPENAPRMPSVHFPIFLVICLFPISTGLVFVLFRSLPVAVSWPHTLADVAQLGRDLHGYSQSGPAQLAHVLAIISVTAVYKHAWSIPGSVIWNVLAGALFSPAHATLLLTLLTTIGSVCATLLSKPLAPFLTHFFPRALDLTRSALEGTKSEQQASQASPWIRLSILRLIGVVPWSGINIACGVTGVPLLDCLLGSFIGSLPWTAVTCQIGDILQTVASAPSPTPQTISSILLSPEIILKLVFLSFLSLAPILGRDHLRALLTSDQPAEDRGRWTWVSKIRIPSPSPLERLVDEKRALEEALPS
ncbi:hypothetical protein BDZ89DRAFT_938387 [Hymenopellis radicata]|nr:hypothetical protein BDZ89DRAFT_938387 [Hymenopellis radicata]